MKTQIANEVSFCDSRIREFARDSAVYLLDIFEADKELEVAGVIGMLAQCCMENNELLAYVRIRRYCKRNSIELPEHFNALAADADVFDFYLRKVVRHMIDLST